MTARRTSATTARVLRQLRRDRRTMLLLLVVPCGLMVLLHFVYAGRPEVFDRVGLPLLAVFPFITMFLVTSVAMLRERTSGTLERLLTTPLSRLDLLVGYAVAFGVVALLQVGVAGGVALGPLGLHARGGVVPVLVVALADALLGMALGLLSSAFAATEFQAVQFMPAVVLPQLLLCGLLAPRDSMAPALRVLSRALPLTYSVDAMSRLAGPSGWSSALVLDLVVVAGGVVLALVAGAATLRRRTP